ncbi:MAG: DegV family protein [Lachnospiraceae bacterium]|nr:DegV family protein [Lachnospiraceae bacterium]
MKKIAIITDSNSGITQREAVELGIKVIPMPFMIGGKEYFEDVNLSQEEFYTLLEGDDDISTSQPSPENILGLWDETLKEYDEILYIPMSSGLSGSCATAMMLAEDYEGKVFVVNNQRISVTLRRSVNDAISLMNQGLDAAAIKKVLEDTKMDSSIYIMVPTLTYLKKGGRLTPAVAAIGSLLKIKPVLQIQGDKLDSFAKVRTINQAKSVMINAIKSDLQNRFEGASPETFELYVAHSNNPDEAEDFRKEIEAELTGYKITCVDPLSLSVSCHIGPGSLAVACAVIK